MVSMLIVFPKIIRLDSREPSMIYRFSIDPDAGIIREHFEGDVTAEFIIKSILKLRIDERFNPDFDSLVDLRDCTLRLKFEDFPRIYEAVAEIFHGGEGRSAVLADGPRNTALAILFQKNVPVRKMATFSTPEMALEWLAAKPVSD